MGDNPFYQASTPTTKFSSEFIRFQMAGYLLSNESGKFHSVKGNFGQIHRKISGKNSSFSDRGTYHSTCYSSNSQTVYLVQL